MPAPYLLTHEVIEDVLRGCAVAGIAWGPNDSPWLEERPESDKPYPWVVFEVADSRVEHAFTGAYTETQEVKVHVVGLETNVRALSSPQLPGSLGFFLDALTERPDALSGNGWQATGWQRTGYGVHKEPTGARDPATQGRVWIATLTYELLTCPQYPETR